MGSHFINRAVRAPLARFGRWIAPPVPAAIRDSLQRAQFENVRNEVPMLLSVAALNVGIIMASCAYDGLPFATYGWLSLLLLYCLVRLVIWSRLFARPVAEAHVPRLIRFNIHATLITTSILGFCAAGIYAADTFKSPLLAPISLAFGSMAIAHCLYSLRPAAIGTLVAGIMPSALAMIVTGDFQAKMIGCSMISVALLMIRFVAAQFDRLVEGLFLEHQIRQLADTDPLTSLPNRRAIMAAIEQEYARGAAFGIALLDLDGFKQVNDSLGHHAGDLMLLGVGHRLENATGEGDRVGRLGGDEFILLFRNVAGRDEVNARTHALLAALCRPIDIDGKRLPVAASLGYALHPDDGDSIREVMHAADTALYAAKRAGRPPARTVAPVGSKAA